MLALPLAVGLVVADARIMTLDPAHPRARHAAIVDGRFAYVGDDLAAARRAAGSGAAEFDALGATVVPGFNDAHVHFGLSLTLGADDAVMLPGDEVDRATFERAVREAAARPPRVDLYPWQHDWIFVTVRKLPPGVRGAADLPHVDRPLFVVTEHGGFINALGQKRAGFSAADAPEGQIRGRLLPAALDRIVKSLPADVLAAGAQRFLAEAARLGITSVQLMDELPELFESLRKSGRLTARVRMMAFGYRFETAHYVPSWRPVDASWVQLDALKYFHDDWARLPRAELARIYDDAQRSGRPIVLHVLSRGALRSLLDQLERMEAQQPGGAYRFRLDHVDEVTPQLATRIARLGLIVCSNPAMLPEWRTEQAFPLHTLQSAGVRTCIGSDWVGRHQPARPLAPLSGLQMAVTHGGFGTEERVSPEEAIEAFTRGSAAAEGRADKGAIQVGMLADLVGLSADPTVVPPEQIGKLEVRFTVVGGRVVYEHRPAVATRPPPPSIGPAGTTPPPVRPPPSTIGPMPRPTPPPATIGPGSSRDTKKSNRAYTLSALFLGGRPWFSVRHLRRSLQDVV
jgi:predicted amidohydrolase YtcJ